MARNDQPAQPEQLQLFFSTRYLNIEQVAQILGVPRSFIYRRTARGHDDPIPHYRLGGHLRFKLDDVEDWIERHRNEPQRESPAALVAAIKEGSSGRSTKPLKQQTGPEAFPVSSLPSGQHMARVTVSEERWLAFRALAIRRKRSVAAYLGHLVQKEIRRAEGVKWRRSLRADEQVEDDPEPDSDEVDESWVPPWEV